MKRWLRWVLSILASFVVATILIGQHYVLNSAKLDEAIRRDIPPGSPKAEVIKFVQERHPVAYDDFGSEVKARLSGRAKNMSYHKDVILTFEFDSDGKLLSYTRKEFLTFF